MSTEDHGELSIEEVIACLEYLRQEGFITLSLGKDGEPMISITEQAMLVEELDEVD